MKENESEGRQKWFEDFDNFDNKTFGFRVFTNPGEMQKHFEEQMEEMMRMFEEDGKDGLKSYDNFNEEFFKLKPGIKKHIEDFHNNRAPGTDTDLDGKAYSDQLKTLLDRIAPDKSQKTPSKENVKRTDEQQVMDYIHDTVQAPPVVPPRPRSSSASSALRRPKTHPGVPQQGIFDGNSPRVFGQSIISQTIRKPDGSYETKRTIRDSNGEVKTTIIRSENGNVQRITTFSDDKGNSLLPPKDTTKRDPNESTDEPLVNLDRTMYLHKDGYTMPRNLF